VTYRVVITDEARARILEQARYIAVEAQAPLNAARWLTRVFEAADSLETMPHRCALAPENGYRPYEVRAMNVDGFLLLFTVSDDERLVIVLNARHGRQLPRPTELPETDPGASANA